jgi:RNA polymerase sigma factor (TIGR02999 family)
MSEVTSILSAIEHGDAYAAQQLLPLVYEELRRLAAAKLAREKPGQTLQATALVHEAYVRLVGKPAASGVGGWSSRAHFFAAAAEAMRRILIDAVRRKRSQRRGGQSGGGQSGGGQSGRCALRDDDLAEIPLNDELLDLDEAIGKLAAADPKAAEVVRLRIFAGMKVEEIAQVQGTSPRTVKRNWAYARAWLGRELAAYDRRPS